MSQHENYDISEIIIVPRFSTSQQIMIVKQWWTYESHWLTFSIAGCRCVYTDYIWFCGLWTSDYSYP